MKIMIDEILKVKDRNRHWLAKKTDTSYPTIVKMCTNKSVSVDLNILEKICKVLDCDVSDVLKVEND